MELLILLAVLVCPVVMGTMMLLMWRGMRGHGSREDAREDAVPPPEVRTSDHREVARR
jgi:hypothetical protein